MISFPAAKPAVLVTDAARGSALAFIRSLGRRGYRVIAADDDRRSPGFRSRHVAGRLVYPSPADSPARFAAWMIEAIGRHKIDVVIPITDEAILPLAGRADRLPGGAVLAVADPTALAVTTNKQATLELARRLDVPVPRTAVVDTVDEALAAAPDLGFPVVLKPLVSRLVSETGTIERLTVGYARDPEDLAARMRVFDGRCGVLLQQFVTGEGRGVELLMCDGRPLAAFEHRRLREVPVTGGASAFRESVPLEPWLYDYATRMLGEIGWTGLAMVEFKVGPDGPRLMEINGRVWGSLPLAVASGMDFPARLVEMLLDGAPPGPVSTDYRVGVRMRNLQLDMVWVASVLAGRTRYPFLKTPPRRRAVAAMLGLLNPLNKFDVMSLSDPRPGLAEVGQLLRKFQQKLSGG